MDERLALPDSHPRIVFLLGLQRCGSTWLANIFDSSPETLCFMEPFSRDDGIFKMLPDSMLFLNGDCPPGKEQLAHDFLCRLVNAKRIFTNQSIYSPFRFVVEKRLATLLSRVPWPRLQARIHTARHINFNRFASYAPLVAKNRAPSVYFIKELRLYGKIPWIRQWFPSAKILCLIRHPCTLVDSVLRWFQRGRLVELKHDISMITEVLSAQKIGARYQELIAQCQGDDPVKRISLLWRVAYETMAQQLAGDPAGQVLYHEDFCLEPEKETRKLFGYTGVPLGPETVNYIRRSTQSARESSGVTETLRHSCRHVQERRGAVDPAIESAVMSIVGDSPLMRHYEPTAE